MAATLSESFSAATFGESEGANIGRHWKQLDPELRRKIARLVKLHRQTEPKRLARLFGISHTRVNEIYREQQYLPTVPLQEALDEFWPRYYGRGL